MDRYKRTSDIVKSYYRYKKTNNETEFIKQVCSFFDYIKDRNINEYDLAFLLFLSNQAGIPQYYDLFKRKYTNLSISDENVNLLSLGAFFHNASLIHGDNKLHRYQKEVLNCFILNKQNRFVLTAPTSFGKTFLMYEIIYKMKYKNIMLIFPTISLLSENYNKLLKSPFFDEYNIYSLSKDEYDFNQKNVFIFTPERYLSFIDKNTNLKFDFSFIDEIYKIDNEFIVDQDTTGENERDITFRFALKFICDGSKDILLAGPFISLPSMSANNNSSFANFAHDNNFEFLDYNQFEIVEKTYYTIKNKNKYIIDKSEILLDTNKKIDKLFTMIKSVSSSANNTIIYCPTKSQTEKYAILLLKNQKLILDFQCKCYSGEEQIFNIFLEHLESIFGNDWIVFKALKTRIGIHHGLIPKYIQKEIINLFNRGVLICLFSTTTITEGVNTTAKNIIITSNKKGKKPLKQFDAKNIAGRAGRFNQHYRGIVIDLNNDFEKIINENQKNIEHKNYDINSIKTDIDYQITKDEYLSEKDKLKRDSLQKKIDELHIDPKVFNSFKVINQEDKLRLYSKIADLDQSELELIKNISMDLAKSNTSQLNLKNFQFIVNIIEPIVKEDKIKGLINVKPGKDKVYSLLTILLNAYLKGGFLSMIHYYTNEHNPPYSKDQAIRKVADYVYNVFRYHLVKYLGLFDIFYRYRISLIKFIDIDEVSGLGLLLRKLEYNAVNYKARRLSDFGVPFNIISYYDNDNLLVKNFDKYEKYVDDNIQILLK